MTDLWCFMAKMYLHTKMEVFVSTHPEANGHTHTHTYITKYYLPVYTGDIKREQNYQCGKNKLLKL